VRAIHPEVVLHAAPEHGEGPVWVDGEDRLLWVDITCGLVHRTDPERGEDEVIDVRQHVGVVVSRAGGGLALALKDGFALREPDGVLALVASVTRDEPGIRFNDGKCDPVGRFLAGTMAYDARTAAARVRLHPWRDGAAGAALRRVSCRKRGSTHATAGQTGDRHRRRAWHRRGNRRASRRGGRAGRHLRRGRRTRLRRRARLAATPGAVFHRCDITVESDVEAATRAAVDAFGGLDVLVNNAGVNTYFDAATMTEEWEAVFAVDLEGAWLCTKHALPALRAAAAGAIVNIASIHARLTTAGMFPYAAAKSGLVGMTRSLPLTTPATTCA
jgi:NAD(P)-dependent dehydrogenase (short-subunit alcohol dehydrogenase family)